MFKAAFRIHHCLDFSKQLLKREEISFPERVNFPQRGHPCTLDVETV